MSDVEMNKVECNIDGVTMYEGHKKGTHRSKVTISVDVDKETKEKCADLVSNMVRETFGTAKFWASSPGWYNKEDPYRFTITFSRKWKYKNDFVSPMGVFGMLTAQHGNLVDKLKELVEKAKVDAFDKERAKELIREVNNVASQFGESCIKKGKEAIGFDAKLEALYAELDQAAKEALRKEIEEEDWTYSSGAVIPPLVRTMVLEKADARLNGELKARRDPYFIFESEDKVLNDRDSEDVTLCVERIRNEQPDYRYQSGEEDEDEAKQEATA